MPPMSDEAADELVAALADLLVEATDLLETEEDHDDDVEIDR